MGYGVDGSKDYWIVKNRYCLQAAYLLLLPEEAAPEACPTLHGGLCLATLSPLCSILR